MPAGTSGSSIGGIGVGVASVFDKGATANRAAETFLNWLGLPAQGAYLASANGGLPSSPTSSTQPLVQKQIAGDPTYKTFADQLRSSRSRPTILAYAALSQALYTQIDAALRGSVAAAALAKAAADAAIAKAATNMTTPAGQPRRSTRAGRTRTRSMAERPLTDRRGERTSAYLFVAPVLVLTLVFSVIPLVLVLQAQPVHRQRLRPAPEFAGLRQLPRGVPDRRRARADRHRGLHGGLRGGLHGARPGHRVAARRQAAGAARRSARSSSSRWWCRPSPPR